MTRWIVAGGLLVGPMAWGAEVTAGDPIVLGPRSAAGISAVVQQSLPAIADCGESSGRLVVKFTVAPKGQVTAASIKASTLTVPAVEGCVLSVLLKLRFPKEKGQESTTVSYPLGFGAAAPAPAAPAAPPAAVAPPPVVAPGGLRRTAAALVVGAVDPREVDAAVDAQLGALGACLVPTKAAGSVVVRFGFDAAGVAQQIVIIDGTADATAVAPCFATHLGDLRVGPAAGPRAAYVGLTLSE